MRKYITRYIAVCRGRKSSYLEAIFDSEDGYTADSIICQVLIPKWVTIPASRQPEVKEWGSPVPEHGAREHIVIKWEPDEDLILVGAQISAPGEIAQWGSPHTGDFSQSFNGENVHILLCADRI